MIKRIAPIVAFAAMAGCGLNVVDLRPGLGASTAQPTRVVAPAPRPAPVPIMTAKNRLVSAIEGQGCELNASNVSVVLTNATISSDELKDLVPQLQSEGRVEVKNGGAIRVISSQCANA